MAEDTPAAREVSERALQRPGVLDDAIDLKPFDLLDDIHNAVNDYAAQGMDAFEECLAKNLKLDKLQLKILLQGSAHLFSNLQADLGRHMQRFEQAAVRTSLRVPPGLLHPSSLPQAEAPPCTPEDERTADSQLAQLRQRIEQVRKERMDLDVQTLSMERELKTYGDLSELEAVAATVGGKENIAGDAAVIGSRARELEQLIPQIAVRQSARIDTVLDPQKAAQLAERSMQHTKAALGADSASDLLDQLQQQA